MNKLNWSLMGTSAGLLAFIFFYIGMLDLVVAHLVVSHNSGRLLLTAVILVSLGYVIVRRQIHR